MNNESSWIIVERATGKAVSETWNDETAHLMSTGFYSAHYEALRPSVYLPRLNNPATKEYAYARRAQS